MGTFFVILTASVIVGAVKGLIPFFLGRYMGRHPFGYSLKGHTFSGKMKNKESRYLWKTDR